jgi:hypothetical protein
VARFRSIEVVYFYSFQIWTCPKTDPNTRTRELIFIKLSRPLARGAKHFLLVANNLSIRFECYPVDKNSQIFDGDFTCIRNSDLVACAKFWIGPHGSSLGKFFLCCRPLFNKQLRADAVQFIGQSTRGQACFID